jgi:hypothetical protein
VIPSRACAYVTMPDRKSAFKVIDKMQNLVVAKKNIKVSTVFLELSNILSCFVIYPIISIILIMPSHSEKSI